jgi:hypothetical protein
LQRRGHRRDQPLGQCRRDPGSVDGSPSHVDTWVFGTPANLQIWRMCSGSAGG